jgi:hypothetical protein
MSFFVRVGCRQRTSISGEDITGPMNRRINANPKFVQNAECARGGTPAKDFPSFSTSERRRQAHLNRCPTRNLMARNARVLRQPVEKIPPKFKSLTTRTVGRYQTVLGDLRLSWRSCLSAHHHSRASSQKVCYWHVMPSSVAFDSASKNHASRFSGALAELPKWNPIPVPTARSKIATA